MIPRGIRVLKKPKKRVFFAHSAFTHALVAVLWGTALVWAGMALCLWRASGRQAPQRGVELRFP